MTTSMAILQLCPSSFKPNQISSSKRKPSQIPRTLHEHFFNRRRTLASALSTTFLALFNPNAALAIDLRLTVPDQTVEEAEAVIRSHAQDLLGIKALIELESWKETQTALRKISGDLKQDLYTIIQGKPGNQRSSLRKLYSNLFNNISKLDYAARSKDANKVMECYNNIVATLGDIFAKI